MISETTQQSHKINSKVLQKFYKHRINPKYNFGPKTDDAASKLDRMLEFNRIIFSQKPRNIICVGHSNWLKRYCKTFLPKKYSDSHISTKQKLYNCGIMSFTVCRVTRNDNDLYGIDPSSIRVLYRGFPQKL